MMRARVLKAERERRGDWGFSSSVCALTARGPVVLDGFRDVISRTVVGCFFFFCFYFLKCGNIYVVFK